MSQVDLARMLRGAADGPCPAFSAAGVVALVDERPVASVAYGTEARFADADGLQEVGSRLRRGRARVRPRHEHEIQPTLEIAQPGGGRLLAHTELPRRGREAAAPHDRVEESQFGEVGEVHVINDTSIACT